MITEDYVSFETAKLLKEKGFNEECFMFWRYDKANDEDDTDGISLSSWNEDNSNRVTNSELDEYFDDEFRSEGYLAPTLQMAMRWLREVHHIVIVIQPLSFNGAKDCLCDNWTYSVWVDYNLKIGESLRNVNGYYSTYEEACEAAIKSGLFFVDSDIDSHD